MREGAELSVLNLVDVLPNRFQPRLKFDDVALEELARSIDKFGVIEPIVSTNVGQQGRSITFKTTVSAKIIKINTDK